MGGFVAVITLIVLCTAEANERHYHHTIQKRAVARYLTEEQKEAILDKHNERRSAVRPWAANMLKMKWHDGLAKLATDYTRKCLFVHNEERKLEGFNYVGENLHVSAGHNVESKGYGAGAVESWDNEREYYNYYTLTCHPGKACGHYTQVAWAKSEYVGCGMTTCDRIDVFGKIWKDATVFACNYGPGGNYGGQKIFIEGLPCSKCPSAEYWCDNALCTNGATSTDMVQHYIIILTCLLASYAFLR